MTDKKVWKYRYESLDRFGLFFVGIFVGAVAELTEIRGLGIIIGTSGTVCCILLMFFIKKYLKARQGELK